jgi:hypothetical protein
LITSIEELADFADRVRESEAFGYDIETGYLGPDREEASIHPKTALLAGISFRTPPTGRGTCRSRPHNPGDQRRSLLVRTSANKPRAIPNIQTSLASTRPCGVGLRLPSCYAMQPGNRALVGVALIEARIENEGASDDATG